MSFQPAVNVSRSWDISLSFLSTKLSKPNVCFLHLHASLLRLATSRVAHGHCVRAGSVIPAAARIGGGTPPGHLRPSVCSLALKAATWRPSWDCFALLLSWRPCFLGCRYSHSPLVVLPSHGGQRPAVSMPVSWVTLVRSGCSPPGAAA